MLLLTLVLINVVCDVYGHYARENEIKMWFDEINEETVKYNKMAADIAWDSSTDPHNLQLPHKAAEYQKERSVWQHRTCDRLATLRSEHLLNATQRRQTYLLCRGPVFTYNDIRKTSVLIEELQSIYVDSRVCIPTTRNVSTESVTAIEDAILNYLSSVKQYLQKESPNDVTDFVGFASKINSKFAGSEDNRLCLRGEPDLEKLMASSRNEEVLKWTWLVWREKVGPPMREPYLKLVQLENEAAKRNGYRDIGASWRDELETSGLRELCRRLYDHVRPLYVLLHGVSRFFLRQQYGEIVPAHGPIPAHLLGDLWSQNWESLAGLVYPNSPNFDDNILKLNWTVLHMVKRAEDFYQSLGLPPMSEQFWRKSIFEREGDVTRCHGTAADMFKKGDYRLIYCSRTSADDFYVLHHEMGHIQYYMAYENQPGIFRQGANSAFQESIGDAIMYGVLSPQHLYRLGLINETYLYVNTSGHPVELSNIVDNSRRNDQSSGKVENKTRYIEDVAPTHDELILLKQALNRIPQIPFSLLVDEYRWRLFEGDIDRENINKEFWNMVLELQGVAPPDGVREEEYFDIGAKFHVPDNTPYIRYFLSSFLQMQIFEAMCKAAVFGRRDDRNDLPETMPLSRCDVYGSKAAGKILKDIMSKGGSMHWQEILRSAIGTDDITHLSLIRYYQPLTKTLTRLVRAHRIPLGW